MITRIVILNSDVYAKADIQLNDAESIQIVGPNNIGKSTLIYTLNFLFIIDGKKMTFSGNRIGDRNTINHYFPTINKSYILFEIFKKRYYTILIKKNVDGGLDYFKIDSDFKESLFINNDTSELYNFDNVRTNLAINNIELKSFKDKREIFNFIYRQGKNNDAVIWLDSNVKSDGISNNFSKIYKYLINSKLITNRTLKDSLIIADKREKEEITFSKKNQSDINKLLKINDEIKIIQKIKKDFDEFKLLVDKYNAHGKILKDIVFNYNTKYKSVFQDTDLNRQEKQKEKDNYYNELTETLRPRQRDLLINKGKLEENRKSIEKELDIQKKQRDEILSFEGISFLREQSENTDKKRRNIESQITSIENQDLKSPDIKKKIEYLQSQIKSKKAKVINYSNLLIHQISKSKDVRELINTIFIDDITGLTKDSIEKEINNISEIMQLFDGAIKLPEITTNPIESIESIKREINKLEKELAINKSLLPIAKELEKHKSELKEIKIQLEKINIKIQKTESLPDIKKEITRLTEQFDNANEGFDNLEKDIKKLDEYIGKTTDKLSLISKQIKELEIRINLIKEWKSEIELSAIIGTESETSESLDYLFNSFKRNIVERGLIKNQKNILFERLKNKTETTFADESKLIEFIESELATIIEKEKSIEGLLQSISAQFATPAKTIIARFEEFKTFVHNRFNSKLKKIKISDIDSLKIKLIEREKIFEDLKKIMQIRELNTQNILFDDQSENLKVLNKYLDDQTTIKFDDLFEIKLHLEKKGKKKIVDLKNQIESDGTDKMIRLVIIMAIINRLVINDKENRVVIFIDEIGTIDENNRIELLNFCKENNFYPISAAPLHPYDGFDKYYFIRRSKKKTVVSEKTGSVIYRKNLN